MLTRIWRRLRLQAGDVYRHGSALVSIAQDETRVLAHFDGGVEVAADLLVAADGAQFTVRRQLLPAVEPRYAGYVAWRGMADIAELSGEARDPRSTAKQVRILPAGRRTGVGLSGRRRRELGGPL